MCGISIEDSSQRPLQRKCSKGYRSNVPRHLPKGPDQDRHAVKKLFPISTIVYYKYMRKDAKQTFNQTKFEKQLYADLTVIERGLLTPWDHGLKKPRGPLGTWGQTVTPSSARKATLLKTWMILYASIIQMAICRPGAVNYGPLNIA